MLKSYPARYPTSGARTGARVIRLTVDQEAVLQEQFNRWPRAPHTADIVLLAAETGLSEADVEVSKHISITYYIKEINVRYLNKRIRRVRYIDKNTLQSLTFVLGMVRYQIGSVAERTRSRRESGHTLIV